MKNAQSIYYLIGATILIIVVNTIFFLLQSSRNEKNYAEGRTTYGIIETANSLIANLKEAETNQRGFILTGDTSYLKPYSIANETIDDIFLNLYSSLSEKPLQRRNLARLNQLILTRKKELTETVTLFKAGETARAFSIVRSNTGKKAMDEIQAIVHKITDTEEQRLNQNTQSIERLTKRIQIFSVISNWILLLIVISALISIVQNREKISELFKEVENKNKLLENQKTELQNLSQDLIKQNDELERFAYVASHDLRSPGVNLIALLQLYEDAKDEEEKKSLMDIIREVSDNLIVKLDDLIEMLRSKHESSAIYEHLTFKQIYSNAVKNLSADIKKSNATLDYDFSEVPQIRYPKSYLESIMQNLLSNAIKYRQPDRAPKVTVKTYMLDGNTYMQVSDNGRGIDLKKYGDQMFGIYKTFHGNNDSKGVGLYITKAQIVAMGGSIEVSSTPNEGTTFTICFNQKNSD